VIVGAGYGIGHWLWPSSVSAYAHRTLTAGAATLILKGSWHTAQPPRVPGLSFRAREAADSPSGVITLGVLREAEGRYLLPATFKKSLDHEPHPEGVRLGAASAYRLKGVALKGFPTRVTVLLAPTSAGAVAILCVAPESARPPATSCEAASSSLRLSGAQPLPLGPNPRYARVLSSAITEAQKATASEHALARAQTRSDQARLSFAVSKIYASSAALLATGKPGPDASATNANLIKALQATAHDYARMSTAARDGNASAFHEAGSRRLASQRSIKSSLAALRTDGYV
jgi:hypothetical protein